MSSSLVNFSLKPVEINSEWTGVNFYTYEAIFYSKAKLICVCCYTQETKFIEDNWIEVMDTVATEYVAANLDDFEIWNVYLVFLSHGKLNKEIQYKIENDKFSMRKIYIQLMSDSYHKNIQQEILPYINNKLLLDEIDLKKQHEATAKKDEEIHISSIGRKALDIKAFASRTHEDSVNRRAWIKHVIDNMVKNED